MPTPVITTTLHCTTCGEVVTDEDFEGNIKRMSKTPFPLPVEPVKCAKHRTDKNYKAPA